VRRETTMSAPRLLTSRLDLDAVTRADAPRLVELAGDERIAATTSEIPHPYELQDATRWIDRMPSAEVGGRFAWGVRLASSGELIGIVSLALERDRPIGLLAYWIGVAYWNNGYATEAAGAVVLYGFESLGLDQVQAIHLTSNPASGRVLRKLGMEHVSSSIDIVRGELVSIERYALSRVPPAGSGI
jgi:[ribosomal protein S5]-alanine N-acetyltransferase